MAFPVIDARDPVIQDPVLSQLSQFISLMHRGKEREQNQEQFLAQMTENQRISLRTFATKMFEDAKDAPLDMQPEIRKKSASLFRFVTPDVTFPEDFETMVTHGYKSPDHYYKEAITEGTRADTEKTRKQTGALPTAQEAQDAREADLAASKQASALRAQQIEASKQSVKESKAREMLLEEQAGLAKKKTEAEGAREVLTAKERLAEIEAAEELAIRDDLEKILGSGGGSKQFLEVVLSTDKGGRSLFDPNTAAGGKPMSDAQVAAFNVFVTKHPSLGIGQIKKGKKKAWLRPWFLEEDTLELSTTQGIVPDSILKGILDGVYE